MAAVSPVPRQMWRGEPSPGADVGRGEPSRHLQASRTSTARLRRAPPPSPRAAPPAAARGTRRRRADCAATCTPEAPGRPHPTLTAVRGARVFACVRARGGRLAVGCGPGCVLADPGSLAQYFGTNHRVHVPVATSTRRTRCIALLLRCSGPHGVQHDALQHRQVVEHRQQPAQPSPGADVGWGGPSPGADAGFHG